MTQTSWFDWDLGIDQYVNCKKNHLISKAIKFRKKQKLKFVKASAGNQFELVRKTHIG